MTDELLRYASIIAEKVNLIIDEVVRGEEKHLYNASLHLLKAGGKRLRPLLTVLSARLFGMDEELALYPAASVELLHNFTLIHDDIMDKDEFRRGVPTVHKVYGEAMAILAGDLLFSKSYEAMLRLVGKVPDALIVKALKELTWAAVTVAEGQSLDMEFESRNDVKMEEYLTMIFKKTAALFKACAYIGGVIAGADEEDLTRISEFAKCVGISFQIRDDELGLIGDEKVLGKPVFSDLREGKKTLLIIYALNNVSSSNREVILRNLGKSQASEEDLRRVAKIVIDSGALEFSNKVAEEYLSKGLSALEEIHAKDLGAKGMLRDFALFLTKRLY
ncbi:MAG: polyprenyl synthetase family protein [Sulfolobales archaeon]